MWWARAETFLKKFGTSQDMTASPGRPCTGEHTQHICTLAGKADFAKITDLAGNAKFVCMNCGRVARDRGNLCNPIEFDKISIGVPHI